MGNNTSTTRKSTAGVRHSSAGGVRKASSLRKETDLDEEFSDLILHEVTKQHAQQQHQQQVQGDFPLQQQVPSQSEPYNPHQPNLTQSVLRPVTEVNVAPVSSTINDVYGKFSSKRSVEPVIPEGKRRRNSSIPYKQFSNDLIEDEYNELNDGLLETDATELSRNILPNSGDGVMGDIEMEGVEENSSNGIVNKPGNSDMELSPTPDFSSVDFTKLAPAGQERIAQATTPSISTSSSTTPQLIPVEIKWVNVSKENIQKISIIGSFSNWRDVIRLKPAPEHPNEYVTSIHLPLGVHKLLYIINNEYRVSDQLPTATDQEGIFFNWFEVLDEVHLFNHSQNQHTHIGASTDYDANIIAPNNGATQTAGRYEVDRINKKSTSFLTQQTKNQEQPETEHVEFQHIEDHPMTPPPPPPQAPHSTMMVPESEETPTYVSYQDQKTGSFFNDIVQQKLNYSSEIPEMFVNYDYFKNKSSDYQLPEPPQLPAHLNNVLLNKMSANHAINNPPHMIRKGSHPPQPQLNSNDFFKQPHASFHDGGSGQNKRPPLRRADSSYYASNQEAYHLSIPNHVILNHLMTTSIRNDVLTVACITRYSGKFVTQIMHSPADP
ncbi:hypothetical protein CAAN1_06S04918 [[Candida] anglica]|uniref:Association with the SNF1 complex (ASC) domain-containing protein n=1 Tax=[Candida] anglica TaxID=148631 RepID=A0ABP0EL53_9ASCO